MFEDTNKGHTCYCENCLKLQTENEELKEMNNNLSEKFANVCGGCFEEELREKYKQCLDWIEEYCMSIKNYSFDEKDRTLFVYYSGAKDVVNHILLNIIKQTKDGEDNDN